MKSRFRESARAQKFWHFLYAKICLYLKHRNNWEESLKWLIYSSNISHLKTRLSYEQEIIRLFKSLDISVLIVKLSYNSLQTFISELVNKR
jgi:hypothetical protein